MHERSLVRALIEQVLIEARQRKLGAIRGVAVDIGEFSGVEPQLVSAAFEELAVTAFGGNVKLDLKTTPLEARCQSCQTEFRVVRFHFLCPQCGSESDVVAGEEVRLIGITAETSMLVGDARCL